jgi:hypothetical protein
VAVSLDEDQLDAGIAGLDAKLAGIQGGQVKVGFDQAAFDAELADAQAKLDALKAGTNAGLLGLSPAEFDAEYAAIKAKLDALAAQQVNVRIGTTGGPEATAQLAGMAAVMKAVEANSGPLVAAIMGLGAAEKSVGGTSDDTTSKVRATGAAVTAAGQAARSAGGMWGMLTKEVTLFGGALGDIHMVGIIPLWHILMDGILETVIGLTEASIAIGVFAAAAAPAAEDIYTHIKSTDDVVKSLGVDIPPITGNFHDLAKAMAPQVLELYGGALNMLGHSGNSLEDVVSKLVTGFDDWMAKLDLFSAKQSHTDGLVQSGAGVLEQMSHVLDNLGVAFENLMKADPGTVHFLLDVVEGASKLVEVFTEIPTPILYTALAIHSFLLWGGLLTTWATKLASPLVSAGKAIYSLAAGLGVFGEDAQAAAVAAKAVAAAEAEAGEGATKTKTIFTALAGAGVWGWAAIGVAALGGLVYWMTTADTATKSFIANLDNGLASLNAGQAILQIGADVQQLDHQLTQVGPHLQDVNEQANQMSTSFGKSIEAAIGGVPEMLSSWSAFGKEFGNIGDSITGGVKLIGSEVGLLHNFFAQGSDIAAYKAAIVSLTGEQTRLFGETGKLMEQGYSYSQSLALMDLAGVQASDTLDLMKQKVDNLITGYKAMSVQGGMLANSVEAVTFSSEEQSSKISALTQGWTTFIGVVTGGEDQFSTFETQMQGLATAASTADATLKVSGGSAALSTTGTAAKGTTVAIDGLSAASLQLKSTWVTAITDANSMENALMTQASAAGLGAKGTAMLTQAGKDMVAQLLPMAKGSSDATAQLYALAQQAGYQGPDAFQSLTTWVGKTKDAEQNLEQITGQLTIASANLATDVNNLANAVNQNLNSAMATAIVQAGGGQKAFDAFATATVQNHHDLDDMKTSATNLASELISTLGTTTQAHNEFDTFAIAMGYSKQQADHLRASVVRLAEAEARIPAHVSSIIQITEQIEQTGQHITAGIPAGVAAPSKLAAGGPVRGGSGRPGADDIPTLLSNNEFVIKAPAVDHYGAGVFESLNAMKYAGGGLVGAGNLQGGRNDPAPVGGGHEFNFNYYGTQQPTPEQKQAVIMDLTRAVGVAG